MPRTFLISCDLWSMHPLVSGALQSVPLDAQVFLAIGNREKAQKEMDLSSGHQPVFLRAVEPHEIFAHTGRVDAVLYAGNSERYAKEFIDVSIAHGIPHFVLLSMNRDDSKWVGEGLEHLTGITFVDSLIRIEDHLRSKTVGTQTTWTILQRVEYMDAVNRGMPGGATIASLWAGLPASTKVQLVSMSDVGWFGAQALLEPSTWRNKTIRIAGDELTFDEANIIYKEVSGAGIDTNFIFVGAGLKWLFPSLQNKVEWLEQTGHHVDIEVCRAYHPELQDYANWVRRHSNGK